MKNLLLLLAALLCSCGSDSSAAPKKNNVIHLDSVLIPHDFVSPEDQRQIQLDAIARAEHEYGVKIVVDRHSEPASKAPRLTLDDFEYSLLYYANLAFSQGYCVKGKNRICLISGGVLFDAEGADYGAGQATRICAVKKKGAAAWYTARSYNGVGEPRQIVSTSAGVHELSHLLGAEHQDFVGCIVGSPGCTSEGRESLNVMNGHAGSYGNIPLPVLSQTHSQVNRCLKESGLRRAKNRRPEREHLSH